MMNHNNDMITTTTTTTTINCNEDTITNTHSTNTGLAGREHVIVSLSLRRFTRTAIKLFTIYMISYMW